MIIKHIESPYVKKKKVVSLLNHSVSFYLKYNFPLLIIYIIIYASIIVGHITFYFPFFIFQ